MVHETKMKDKEPLNKININKKAKAQIELGNLAMRLIILAICPDLTKIMTELCSDSMKAKKKKTPLRRKKPLWKEKIGREIEHMQRELSILT